MALAGVEDAGTTDPDGRFEIPAVAAGTYRAVIAAPGFTEQILEAVEVAPAATAQLLVTLQALPTHVEEIIVTPGRHAIVQEEQAATRTLSGADAMLVPNVGSDVCRVVELLPGVTAPDNSAGFHLRGAPRDGLRSGRLELDAPFHLESPARSA